MRQLIRFIKDLSLVETPFEILSILRKELFRFSGVGEPILSICLSERQCRYLTLQGKRNIEKIVFQKQELSSENESLYLANLFSRPFGRVYHIPLNLRGTGHHSIILEHSLSDTEVRRVHEAITTYMQPFSIALDRSLLEYRLRIASMQWESTFDQARDLIAIMDIDFEIVRVNRTFKSKKVSQKCFELFFSNATVCSGCPMNLALKTGQPQVSQIVSKGRVYQVHSYPILFQENQFSTNVVNHYIDITESRELYGKVIQSEKMAAIGTLAGNIAHELNNPLTGIRSLAQVLLKEIDPQSLTWSDLIEVEKATARSQVIIKNLLDFAQQKEGELRETTMEEIVRKTLPLLKTAMRNHRSEHLLSEHEEPVYVEPYLMQQVVYNLVNNACQAMPKGGMLTIETRSDLKKGIVSLLVRDNGPGIAPELVQQIFEPFFTTKEEGKGTGLGLSVSKTIVESFGGQIGVTSEPGKGALFWVDIPIVRLE